MNAFAYNTSSSIFLNAYEYQENECKYEELYHIPIENQDFVFLDSQSILSVGVNNLAIIDLQTQKNTFYNIETGSHPHIQPISSDLFAIINKGKCCVYDIREGCDTRCEFYHNSNILETSHEGSTIFIAGSEDISAHDVRNPRGPVLWSYSTNKEIPFCSFNIKEKFALCGNHIINLMNGKCVSKSDVYNPVCGSIYDNKIAIIGSERRSLLFYNYQKHEEVATFMFTEHEGIKSIDSSSMNGYVAVAADYNVKILKAPTENEPNVSEVRNVLCGSIAQRKRGEIGPVKQVVFDGERLITNMGSFVRVYDFYTGKAFVKK
ncbi:hypothetical protein GPJ56_006484 [Histomonas meleagridis]|uniref:uncharacterized protein n=1 Tax=Histomonas meleagridis TaxID=135588 RepID=UPI00355A0C72|nr:hypothetical protein GPJ56_006484 [Histomonas meleagridis]KAH0798853.1 hypothetical protein GO595_008339 [Histomonas meleagridis]